MDDFLEVDLDGLKMHKEMEGKEMEEKSEGAISSLKDAIKNIESSLGIMPNKTEKKPLDLADQIKNMWAGMINGPKLQLNSIYQELNSLIVVRDYINTLVNGVIKKTVRVDEAGKSSIVQSFVVCKDEEEKLRRLLDKLDYEIISKSLSVLEIYNSPPTYTISTNIEIK